MGNVIIPCPAVEGWDAVDSVPVELARQRQIQGRLFRKHVLTKGTLIHPVTGAQIKIDDAFTARLRENFTNGVCDIVQVPIADSNNKHTETPLANIGEVVDLQESGDKLYALIDARDSAAADKLGKTLLGASAFLSTDYTDTTTGQKAGPTLLHVAITNRPYCTGLEDYEEIVAATAADNSGDEAVVLTPEEDMPMTREEMLAALKAEHGIDVAALQEQAGHGSEVSQLTAALTQALGQGGIQLTQPDGGTGLTGEDIVGAISELAQLTTSQQNRIDEMARERAGAEVDGYISEGRVLPKQREAFTELALSNREMLDALLPDKPVVPLNQQAGVGGTPQGEGKHTANLDDELARLTGAEHTSRFFTPNGTTKRG